MREIIKPGSFPKVLEFECIRCKERWVTDEWKKEEDLLLAFSVCNFCKHENSSKINA